MNYYRRTQTNNPMSDWGHAMFADHDTYELYGDYQWQLDTSKAVNINDLKDAIISAWDSEDNELQYTYGCNGEEMFNSFNPDDIIDSAQAYDNGDLVTWLWDSILEDADIKTIITEDGAVTFDPECCIKI